VLPKRGFVTRGKGNMKIDSMDLNVFALDEVAAVYRAAARRAFGLYARSVRRGRPCSSFLDLDSRSTQMY
jgi:hypothetical protein